MTRISIWMLRGGSLPNHRIGWRRFISLSHDDVWRTKLTILEPLSSYATSYRYPSTTGKRKGGPSSDEVHVWIKTIAGLCAEVRELVALVSPRAGRTT